MAELIYFDNNSTTRLDDNVLLGMLPYLTESYGNAASQHSFGIKINKTVEHSRGVIAELIGSSPDELIFTSGATESLNIALKGLALQERNNRNKIITVSTEHKAVLDICAYLEQIGFEIVYLPVKNCGLLDLESLKQEIDEQTIAVCVMLVNNETGVIHPIRTIADLCHEKDVLLICDATQALGKMSVDIKELGADLLAFSGHKFHGPKGIGALYVRRGIALAEVVHGGGHETGLRSGTLNVPAIVGMTTAFQIAVRDLEKNRELTRGLRDLLEKELLAIPGTKLNGHPLLRAPNVANITFPGVDAGILIAELQILAVSNGSACASLVFEPSHVLTAMGLSDTEAFAAIRFSLSKYNNRNEVVQVVKLLKDYLRTRVLP